MEWNEREQTFKAKDGLKIHFKETAMGTSDKYTLILEYGDGTFITAGDFMAVIGHGGKIGYLTKEAAMKEHSKRRQEEMKAVDFVKKFKEILKN